MTHGICPSEFGRDLRRTQYHPQVIGYSLLPFAELVQRIHEGTILGRYQQVRIGVVNLLAKLRPPGSIEHPFVGSMLIW